jgi:hypothetical protein
MRRLNSTSIFNDYVQNLSVGIGTKSQFLITGIKCP